MIADKLDRLALAMLEAPGDPRRTTLAAAHLADLGAQVRQMEQAPIPTRLRPDAAALPPGVVARCGRRAGA